tara:strand:+ start:2120 stop:2359 length:240 start_codon:yes stop_codon:yes gene_type:complete
MVLTRLPPDLKALADGFEDALLEAYFAECDRQGRAVDPADLELPDWTESLMASAYEVALKVEAVARARGLGWYEASDFV